MENETNFVSYEGLVPESETHNRERKNRYGSVPGLDDDELADPDELERQVIGIEIVCATHHGEVERSIDAVVRPKQFNRST